MNRPTPCRVLVVDDAEDTRFQPQTQLTREGYAAEAAGTIEEALRLAGENAFDLYVIDKRFPDGDGAELCRRLKEQDGHAPIVMYSGLAY